MEDLLYEEINNPKPDRVEESSKDSFFFEVILENTSSDDIGVTLMNIDNPVDTNPSNTTKITFSFSGLLNISQNTLFTISYYAGNNTSFGQVSTKTFNLRRYASQQDIIQQLNSQGLDTFTFIGDQLTVYTNQYTYTLINLSGIANITSIRTANTVLPVTISSPSNYSLIKGSLRPQNYLVKQIFISAMQNKRQMYQPFNFYKNSFTGQSSKVIVPALDVYQRTDNLFIKPQEDLILDGYNSIQYIMLADCTIRWIFEGTFINTGMGIDLNSNVLNPRLDKPQNFKKVERRTIIIE